MANKLTPEQQVILLKNQVQLMVAKHERSIKLLEQMALGLEVLEKIINKPADGVVWPDKVEVMADMNKHCHQL